MVLKLFFTIDGIVLADNPLFASISRVLRHASEDSGSILLTSKLEEAKLSCNSHDGGTYLVHQRHNGKSELYIC